MKYSDIFNLDPLANIGIGAINKKVNIPDTNNIIVSSKDITEKIRSYLKSINIDCPIDFEHHVPFKHLSTSLFLRYKDKKFSICIQNIHSKEFYPCHLDSIDFNLHDLKYLVLELPVLINQIIDFSKQFNTDLNNVYSISKNLVIPDTTNYI